MKQAEGLTTEAETTRIGLYVGLLTFLFVGCGSKPVPKSTEAPSVVVDSASELASIQESLRKPNADEEHYRVTLQQLNSVLSRMPEKQPKPLPTEELKKLQEIWGLSDAEAADVNRPEFGPLDAHHVYQCVLFHGIAKTLATDRGLKSASAALHWLDRHVRLIDRPGPPDAPALVVKRGNGNAYERVLVHAALLEQLTPDDCRVHIVGDRESSSAPPQWWGVTITGTDRPSPEDSRVGISLGRAETDDTLLKTWQGYGYDISKKRIEDRLTVISANLSSISPRMAILESLMTGAGVRLATPTPSERPAVSELLAKAQVGVLRVLSEMYPPDEGGTDRSPPGRRRLDRYEQELVPWGQMPGDFLKLPGVVGFQMQQAFAGAVMVTYKSGLPQMLQDRQQFLENARARAEMQTPQDQQYKFNLKEDAGPSLRQLILRGSYAEATQALVALADNLQIIRERNGSSEIADAAKKWATKVPSVYAEALRSQRSQDPKAAAQAQEALAALNAAGQPAVIYMQWAATGYALEDVDYLTAVCKLDQAEARWRSQPDAESTKATARTAVQAWERFVLIHPTSQAAGQALRLQARSHQLAGAPKVAVETYKKAAEKLTGIEKAACLILADQLTSK